MKTTIWSGLYVLAATLASSPASATSMLLPDNPTPVVEDGQSLELFAPHHSVPGNPGHPSPPGPTHYFADTGDADHFRWTDQIPGGPINVFYDFRSPAPFAPPASPNLITPAEEALAVSAFNLWSAGTLGNLVFSQNTTAPLSNIINISAAPIDGPFNILGLGGGVFTHNNALGVHDITFGGVRMDSAENWDLTIGNGNPFGTVDFFTVVVQEIGHALGLGHTDDLPGPDMMDGNYGGEQTVLSFNDICHIRSLYGPGGENTVCAAPMPEPGSLLLLSMGLLGSALVFGYRRRLRRGLGS